MEFIPAKQKEKLFEDTGTKRVCAYCRVSTDDVNQTSSYELQKNHYEDMIKEHQGWELVGIYADEAVIIGLKTLRLKKCQKHAAF